MEVEKKRSKGAFLQLFDWNSKSRKKLFSNNPELDGEQKKEKENVGKMAKSLLHVIEVDESRASPSNDGSSYFNCASPVASDEGYGTRAPGVVARLMGLDSLPTSNAPEPCSDPYTDLCSLSVSHYDRSVPNLWSENRPVHYLNFPNKEWFGRNPVESRVPKVQNWPIEKFQTEVLPPKSAKSIPITHHKLLSPIKSPGFVPTKNTTYVMEAAAKIIEASPQEISKSKRPSIASSVPMKIWDLKEKMEAAQRVPRPQKSNESIAAKFTKRQHIGQSTSESVYPAVKTSMNLEKRSHDNMRKKEKSVSLAVQAKVNVQRKEGSSSSSNRNCTNQKEKSNIKANHFLKSQTDTQRTAQKQTSANRTNNVLRQNNQKQNSISNKNSSTSKTSVLNQESRNAKSISGSIGPNRTVNKVAANFETASRKTGLANNDSGKELSSSKAKNVSRKKQFANQDRQFEESSAGSELNKKGERSVKCNVEIEGGMNWGADNRKKGMDVVSFTFSSPLRSMADSQSTSQVMEKNYSFDIDSFGDNQRYFKNSTFSSPGFNVIGGDALSVLLEQKLKELTCKVESSNCNVIGEGITGSSGSNVHDSVPVLGMVSTKSAERDKRLQLCLDEDISDRLDSACCTSIDSSILSINPKWQLLQSEEMEIHSGSSNNNEVGREFDCQQFSPVSSLESSLTSMSCSDSRNSIDGGKQFSLAQDQAEFSRFPINMYIPVEGETDLSDSASSILVEDVGKRYITRLFSPLDVEKSSSWELGYVREILENAEMMINESVLGQTHQVTRPNIFNQLENQENKIGCDGDEHSKLGRKVLFDCVCECLDFKCEKLFVGSCKGWAKRATLFQRKDWLAEELYKGIQGLKSMGDLMVDELVDKDMSSQYGRWLDFDIEAFEEAVEMENRILTSLVDELVSDLFPSSEELLAF